MKRTFLVSITAVFTVISIWILTKDIRDRYACGQNLKKLDSYYKKQWVYFYPDYMIEANLSDTDKHIYKRPYPAVVPRLRIRSLAWPLKRDGQWFVWELQLELPPTCPAGGSYIYGNTNTPARCSLGMSAEHRKIAQY